MPLVPSTPAGANIMLWLQRGAHSNKSANGSRATANSATLGNSSSQNRAVAAVRCSIWQKCARHSSPSSYLTFGLAISYLLFTEEEFLGMQCGCGSSFVHLEGSVLPASLINHLRRSNIHRRNSIWPPPSAARLVLRCCSSPHLPRRNGRSPLDPQGPCVAWRVR